MKKQRNNRRKAAVLSLGCPKNTVDSEIMLKMLADEGYELTVDLSEAGVIIVNTCSFIEEATRESLSSIMDIVNIRKENPGIIIVTGCMAQRYGKKIQKEIPEVDHVVGTGNIPDIINALHSDKKLTRTDFKYPHSNFMAERIISTPLSYAYLKIAEGCDNSCSYCRIPSLRGRFRSRKAEDILSEASMLAASGYSEIILIAEDTAHYGKDAKEGDNLPSLLYRLENLDSEFSIRLLYCNPESVDDQLIKAIAECDKVIKYIDMPIQHISDRMLSAMNRKTDSAGIREILDHLRCRIRDVAIRSTVIVGFPGETDNDFVQLERFIEEYRIENLGVFTYSREEGTPAYHMKQRVQQAVMFERKDRLMRQQKQITAARNASLYGRIFSAVIDGTSDDGLFYKGRIYSQAPEIDPVSYIAGLKVLKIGDKVNIKIIASDEYDLIGEMTDEPAE